MLQKMLQKDHLYFRLKIEDLKKRFELLALELKEAFEELGGKAFKAKVESLAELEELCAALEKQWERREQNNEQIAKLLSKAEKLSLEPPDSSIDLEHFRGRLESYRQLLFGEGKSKKASELRKQFLKGEHPLNALLALVTKDLPLKRAEELFEKAATEFGAALALAAVRGNIVFKEPPVNKAGEVHRRPSGGLPEKVSSLLHRLLREGKLSPAFWLAAYCEQKYGAAPLPSWLIKALEAALVVRYGEGPAAQCLSYLYKKHSFLVPPGEDSKEKGALELFYFSALLRPALAAPQSGALSYLCGLSALPEKLKNIIAAVVATESGSKKNESIKQELEALYFEAQNWYKQNQKLSLASPLASRLWESMLKEGG